MTNDGLASVEELRVALPEPSLRLTQDNEWCLVETDDGWREFRFHDYADIYGVPGLYEKIFYDILECDSPAMVGRLLRKAAAEQRISPATIRALDLGAGNGMMGEALADWGVDTIVGVDIVDEAKTATERDRPDLYADYLVADVTELQPDERRRLRAHRPNCLTCVAALGFGDIPPLAFAEAYALIEEPGLIAFNIKDEFLRSADPTGFASLIQHMIKDDILSVVHHTSYQHRVATSGDPLQYVAIAGRKRADIPVALLEAVETAA